MPNLELLSYLSRANEPSWTPFRDHYHQQRETLLLCEDENNTQVNKKKKKICNKRILEMRVSNLVLETNRYTS